MENCQYTDVGDLKQNVIHAVNLPYGYSDNLYKISLTITQQCL